MEPTWEFNCSETRKWKKKHQPPAVTGPLEKDCRGQHFSLTIGISRCPGWISLIQVRSCYIFCFSIVRLKLLPIRQIQESKTYKPTVHPPSQGDCVYTHPAELHENHLFLQGCQVCSRFLSFLLLKEPCKTNATSRRAQCNYSNWFVYTLLTNISQDDNKIIAANWSLSNPGVRGDKSAWTKTRSWWTYNTPTVYRRFSMSTRVPIWSCKPPGRL